MKYLLFNITILLIAATSNSITDEKLQELLTGDRTSWQKFPIQYIPIIQTPEDSWHQLQFTKEQIYNSHTKYPSKDAFNYLIDKDNIEAIINENDAIATEQFITGFSYELNKTITVSDTFNKLLEFMGGKGKNLTRNDFDTDEININGFSSDSYYSDPKQGDRASTGMNGQYHLRAKTCGNLKDCNVYSHWRVIHKSQSFNNGQTFTFSCNDIMTQLLPQIYECMNKYDTPKQCPLLLTHGYFRDVWKVRVPNSSNPFYKYVLLKMMRPKKYDDVARDLQRNIRESILLYYLQREEEEYMEKYGHKFISLGEKRAFPYVRELGHCIYPTYITITPYYNVTYESFIKHGQAANNTIKKLIEMSINIAKGTEILHNIRGGPFHHTDIAIDQFMIDENNNVLINDFNRGKFQMYRFNNVTDKYNGIIKCIYCPYESDGRNRAPEELKIEPIDESIDVYSTAMTIWSLFSGTRLWTKPWTINKIYDKDGIESDSSGESVTYEQIRYLVHDTARRPIMPYNMPYALKELIRNAITHNPKNRLNAKEFRKRLQYIYKHLKKYTRNRENVQSFVARSKKLFKDHTYPHVPHNFPKCCKS